MTHEQKVVDQYADFMDKMDNEERFAMLVGNAFLKAYNYDQNFQKLVGQLCQVIRSKKPRRELFWIDDAVNMWLLSSHHQAMAAEFLFNYAEQYQDDSYQFDGLMRIQHDCADGMVHPLVNCLRMLRDTRYSDALGNSSNAIEQVFEKHFPNLIEVRDSMAHENSRVMPTSHLKVTSFPDLAFQMQHKAQGGNRIWGLKSQNRSSEFSISFNTENYIGLVTDLRLLFESV